MSVKIIQGDCMTVLKTLPDNSVDSIVTDPPYGISFMGKHWDYNVPKVEVWQEALRVLKPGGHALIACGTRTQHRMAVNIEDAGFEIRDIVGWIYGSGFPKSLNIGKAVDKLQGNEREVVGDNPNARSSHGTNPLSMQCSPNSIEHKNTKGNSEWEGYGTALKPAMELWTLARKPLSEPTVAANVLKWSTGGINIDDCRVEYNDGTTPEQILKKYTGNNENNDSVTNNFGVGEIKSTNTKSTLQGRFPANLIHDGSDEVVKGFPDSKTSASKPCDCRTDGATSFDAMRGNRPARGYDENGSAARFFYCAKSSKSERNLGLDGYLTVKYSISKGEILCKEEITVAVQLLERAMSDLGLMSFSIDESGESIMALFPKDSLSIILTEINRIIELKTLQSLTLSPINESIAGVSCEKVNGGNLAESAVKCNQSKRDITKEQQAELARGANGVALKMLSLIKDAASRKPLTNIHSTVKPIALMRYLCRLITPPQGTILDCFAGSGSTGIAAKLEGFGFIGIEREAEYCRIAEARIESWKPDAQEVLAL